MYIDITSFIIGAIVWEFASYYLIRSIRQFVRGIKRGIADVKNKKMEPIGEYSNTDIGFTAKLKEEGTR
jgi:hypothetical protein